MYEAAPRETRLAWRVLHAIDGVVAIGACLAASVMTVVVIAEVFLRYLFSVSMPFSNELARVMFIWTIFLGIPLALSRGRHVGITLVDSLPAPLSRAARSASNAASLAILLVVFYKSTELTVANWDQTLNTMPVTAGAYYLPIPIGIGVAILYLVLMIPLSARQLIEDDTEDTAA